MEIVSPYLEADLFDLDVETQSADVLYIFHKDYAPKKLMIIQIFIGNLSDCSFSQWFYSCL